MISSSSYLITIIHDRHKFNACSFSVFYNEPLLQQTNTHVSFKKVWLEVYCAAVTMSLSMSLPPPTGDCMKSIEGKVVILGAQGEEQYIYNLCTL